MQPVTKRILIGLLACSVFAVGTVFAFVHTLDLASQPLANPSTQPSALEFVRLAPQQSRGRMLMVVTSTARAGTTEIAAGLELTELSRAYYTFLANGFSVDIASPKGGKPPIRMDDELIDVDYAFLNDETAQQMLAATIPLSQINPANYVAVYFVGGKGAMFDFPGNQDIRRIASIIHDAGGVVGAVCHGPAALLGVRLSNGKPLLQGRRVTGFTNREELFLIKNARDVFPFMLEDALSKEAGAFVEGHMYLDNTVVDGRLVTGQNPWATWSVAEGMIRALGHEPVARARTSEERAVAVLRAYYVQGLAVAQELHAQVPGADKRLLVMHAFVAMMEGRVRDAFHIQNLART